MLLQLKSKPSPDTNVEDCDRDVREDEERQKTRRSSKKWWDEKATVYITVV